MDNNKNLLKKLNSIPKKELVLLLEKIYESDEKGLKSDLDSILNLKSRDPLKRIKSLDFKSITELIKFQSKRPYISKKIEELYSEWWQSKSPLIFFSEIKKERDNSFYELDLSRQRKNLIDSFKKINEVFDKEDLSEFKNLKLINYKMINNTIEIEFEYQKKIDYIDPATKSPRHIYTLSEGIVWISKIQKAIITKIRDYSLLSNILIELRKLLGCEIVRFNLSKELVNEIFGFESLKKASYVESDVENEEYLERKNVSDKNFPNKKEGKLLDHRCERPSSTHSIDFLENKGTIGVSEKGSIRIYSDICKTDLKKWTTNIIGRIIESTSKFEKDDFKNYLKMVNFEDIPLLKNLNGKAKKIFLEVVVAFLKLKDENKKELKINFSIGEIYTNFKDYFDFLFYPICSDCGDVTYSCNFCKAINSMIISGPGLSLKCGKCGTKINEIQKDIICTNDLNHKFEGGPFDNILALGNIKLTNLINDLAKFVGSEQKFEKTDLMTLKSHLVEYKNIEYRYEYLFDEIPSFTDVIRLEDIPQEKKQAQINNLKIISEKCPASNNGENCRNCMIKQEGLCLSRLVAEFVNEPKLGPHHGHEFGDLTFKEKIDGKIETPLCLIKSARGRINLTPSENSGLIPQLIKCLIDARINFIFIISATNIDGQLKEIIVNLVRNYGKKIVFIEKENIIRLMYKYLNLEKNDLLTEKNWFN